MIKRKNKNKNEKKYIRYDGQGVRFQLQASSPFVSPAEAKRGQGRRAQRSVLCEFCPDDENLLLVAYEDFDIQQRYNTSYEISDHSISPVYFDFIIRI
tara:strand:+ start:177 stop:470 length:294 start_codon:yes stop_codon:yes gene_type:complete